LEEFIMALKVFQGQRLCASVLGVIVAFAAMASLFGVAFGATLSRSHVLYACAKKQSGALRLAHGSCRPTETKVGWNQIGPQGIVGPKGASGANGTNGTNGTNGAVAGYSATQPAGSLIITGQASAVQVPGLIKQLPAGSYIASGTIKASAFQNNGPGYALVDCVVTDTPASAGAPVSYTSRSLFPVIAGPQAGDAELPYTLAFTTSGQGSTLTVSCDNGLNSGGAGMSVTVDSGTLGVIQTSSNS
jgi:hypothetical protein